MQEAYLEDLRHSSEVVLQRPRRVRLVDRPSPPSHTKARGHGRAGRAAAGAIGIGSMNGAAITNHRALGPAEARLTAFAGLALLLLAVLALLWPRLVVVPSAAIGIWIAVALLVRAWRLWRSDDGHTAPRSDS